MRSCIRIRFEFQEVDAFTGFNNREGEYEELHWFGEVA